MLCASSRMASPSHGNDGITSHMASPLAYPTLLTWPSPFAWPSLFAVRLVPHILTSCIVTRLARPHFLLCDSSRAASLLALWLVSRGLTSCTVNHLARPHFLHCDSSRAASLLALWLVSRDIASRKILALLLPLHPLLQAGLGVSCSSAGWTVRFRWILWLDWMSPLVSATLLLPPKCVCKLTKFGRYKPRILHHLSYRCLQINITRRQRQSKLRGINFVLS